MIYVPVNRCIYTFALFMSSSSADKLTRQGWVANVTQLPLSNLLQRVVPVFGLALARSLHLDSAKLCM